MMLFPHTENDCVHTASEVKTMGFRPKDEDLVLAQNGGSSPSPPVYTDCSSRGEDTPDVELLRPENRNSILLW